MWKGRERGEKKRMICPSQGEHDRLKNEWSKVLGCSVNEVRQIRGIALKTELAIIVSFKDVNY